MKKIDKEEILKESEKIVDRFEWITKGVRVITLMKRKKEGGPTRTDRVAKKFISLGEHEFKQVLEKALDLYEPGYRIYCTVNSRDMDKAIRNFKQMMLDNDYNTGEEKYRFYSDIWNRTISSLQKASARDSNWFLIDIDDDDKNGITKQDIVKKLKEKEVITIDTYRTKNGWHIITLPFQYPKLIPELKKWDNIKTDGMALLKF